MDSLHTAKLYCFLNAGTEPKPLRKFPTKINSWYGILRDITRWQWQSKKIFVDRIFYCMANRCWLPRPTQCLTWKKMTEWNLQATFNLFSAEDAFYKFIIDISVCFVLLRSVAWMQRYQLHLMQSFLHLWPGQAQGLLQATDVEAALNCGTVHVQGKAFIPIFCKMECCVSGAEWNMLLLLLAQNMKLLCHRTGMGLKWLQGIITRWWETSWQVLCGQGVKVC